LIQISKRSEPRCLVEQRCNPEATYESPPWDKATLRESLVKEQKAICAFCMQRIVDNRFETKIAHVLTQHEHPQEQLNYGNLVLACKGGEDKPPKDQHCDTRQRSRSLSINPAKPNSGIERLISYGSDGRITSKEEAVQAELDDILNLNLAYLKDGRKAILDKFQMSFPRGPVSQRWLQQALARWSGQDGADLQPYCGVVMYYLRKKLRQL
jgi:uncharacterized protein (TIGR02646 family)